MINIKFKCRKKVFSSSTKKLIWPGFFYDLLMRLAMFKIMALFLWNDLLDFAWFFQKTFRIRLNVSGHDKFQVTQHWLFRFWTKKTIHRQEVIHRRRFGCFSQIHPNTFRPIDVAVNPQVKVSGTATEIFSDKDFFSSFLTMNCVTQFVRGIRMVKTRWLSS